MRSGRRELALHVLVVTYGDRLTAYILRVLHDCELAKDIRQQVFLEAFQGLDRFKERSSLWCWLCGIAYHRCMDEIRRNRKARRMAQSWDPDLVDVLVADSYGMVDEDRVTKQRALERCLGRLHPIMRAQLLMRYFFDLSHQEIGELVGAAHGTVQVRISRNLPLLRRCLRGEGVFR